jgi:hypothetical protein
MNVLRRDVFQILKRANYFSIRYYVNPNANYSYTENMNKIIENIKTEIMKHIDNKNNRFRISIISILSTCLCVGVFYYDDIKKYITYQSTEVAADTINHPKFKQQTIELSSSTVAELCKNPEVQKNLTQLLVIAINTDEVKQAAVQLIKHVYSQNEVNEWTIKLVTDIISSDEVKNTTQASLEHILQNPYFRKEMSETLYNVAIKSMTPSFSFWNNNKDTQIKQETYLNNLND